MHYEASKLEFIMALTRARDEGRCDHLHPHDLPEADEDTRFYLTPDERSGTVYQYDAEMDEINSVAMF